MSVETRRSAKKRQRHGGRSRLALPLARLPVGPYDYDHDHDHEYTYQAEVGGAAVAICVPVPS